VKNRCKSAEEAKVEQYCSYSVLFRVWVKTHLTLETNGTKV